MENLVGVELSKVHYLIIEAADIKAAFSIFKNRLESKEVYVSTYENIDELVVENEHRIDDIVKSFMTSTSQVNESVVWGGLYAGKKENTLDKKFKLNDITQKGTKQWETRYILIGEKTGTRYDTTCTTKGAAVELAKEKVVEVKEDLKVDVEKVLISHDPSVAIVKYLKDPTEHESRYIFIVNTVTFDEEDADSLYEENTELGEDKQYRIKVETIFDYDKRVKL